MNPPTAGQSMTAGPRTSPGRRLWHTRSVVMISSALELAGAVGASGSAIAQAGVGSTTTITFLSVQKANVRVPAGGVEVDVDRNAAGKAVAADALVCRVAGRTKPPKCAVSINLAHGDLFFVITATRTGGAGRLVAGTGRYAGDSGTVLAKTLSPTKTRITIKLHK